ncbi:hypothetical protein ABK040_011498 [Willaertia magna]
MKAKTRVTPKSFSISKIQSFERVFERLYYSTITYPYTPTKQKSTKTLPSSLLSTCLRLCGYSPTSSQLFVYLNMLKDETFSFGQLLDILQRQDLYESQIPFKEIFMQLFAFLDKNKENKININVIKEILLKEGSDRCNETDLNNFLTYAFGNETEVEINDFIHKLSLI